MKNNFITKLQAQKAAEIRMQRLFTMQWCSDAALLAANEVFKRKGEKLAEFNEAFFKYSQLIADMTLDDAKGDKSIEYTKAKIDGQLKELLGESFVPWDERYNF